MKITLITGGAPHYDAGLLSGLVEQEITIDVIGGDDQEHASLFRHQKVTYQNIYKRRNKDASVWQSLLLIAASYIGIIKYAARTESRIFHIQWPYKFVLFDRTALNIYYKALGKKVVYTAHNIDTEARDGRSSCITRFSLRVLYRIVDRIIVHTARMKAELVQTYGISPSKITVIPHGIMTAAPETSLTRSHARRALCLPKESRVLLFFGLITPYKGLEYLVEAMAKLPPTDQEILLLIAGRVKECPSYWANISGLIDRLGLKTRVRMDLRHIQDLEIEKYFKAADALVMPYRKLYQSGVLFLSYRFGLPVIATDVGSFKEDIIEGRTGFVCKADDSSAMADTISRYFQSDLWRDLENRRNDIREYAVKRYSWSNIGAVTAELYSSLVHK